MTQKQIVWNKLLTDGEINNVWAFEHHILRLGGIVHTLRNEGKVIDGGFIPGTKNYRYTTEQRKELYRVGIINGQRIAILA